MVLNLYMIITTSLLNQYRQSRPLLISLAKMFGRNNISFDDVMAYFFSRRTPLSINKYIVENTKFFNTEFGVNRSNIRIISKNFLPDYNSVCSVISLHAVSERIELATLLTLYIPAKDVIEIKTEEFRPVVYGLKIPNWLWRKFEIYLETRYGYEYLFHDNNYLKYIVLDEMSALSNLVKYHTGVSILEYRALRMRLIKAEGVMFFEDKHISDKIKSGNVKKLAKK